MVNPARQVFDPNDLQSMLSLMVTLGGNPNAMFGSVTDTENFNNIDIDATPPIYGNSEEILKEFINSNLSQWLKLMIKPGSNKWAFVSCYPGIAPNTPGSDARSRLTAKYYEIYASYFKDLAVKYPEFCKFYYKTSNEDVPFMQQYPVINPYQPYGYYIQGPLVLVCEGLPTKQFMQELGEIFPNYFNNNFGTGGENGDYSGVGHYSMNSIVYSNEESMIKWVNYVNDLGPFNGEYPTANPYIQYITQLQNTISNRPDLFLTDILTNSENGVNIDINNNDTSCKAYIL